MPEETFETASAGEKFIKLLDAIGLLIVLFATAALVARENGKAFFEPVAPAFAIGFGLMGFPSLFSSRFSQKGFVHKFVVGLEIVLCVATVTILLIAAGRRT
jgi:hypothetical protein